MDSPRSHRLPRRFLVGAILLTIGFLTKGCPCDRDETPTPRSTAAPSASAELTSKPPTPTTASSDATPPSATARDEDEPVGAPSPTDQDGVARVPKAPPVGEETPAYRRVYGATELRLYNGRLMDGVTGRAELRHEGRLVWQDFDYAFQVLILQEKVKVLPTGHVRFAVLKGLPADINGDDHREVVIQKWSGGTHGLFTYWVWSIRDTQPPVLLKKLELGNTELHLCDSDGNGILELWGADDQFAYWAADFDQSPMPPLVYAWSDQGYHLATKFFLGEFTPKLRAYTRMLQDARAPWLRAGGATWRLDGDTTITIPPVDLWDLMLTYIYLGEGKQARLLLDAFWPDQILAGRETFLRRFDAHLRASAFYDEVERMTDPDKRWGLASPTPPTKEKADAKPEDAQP